MHSAVSHLVLLEYVDTGLCAPVFLKLSLLQQELEEVMFAKGGRWRRSQSFSRWTGWPEGWITWLLSRTRQLFEGIHVPDNEAVGED
jgi:hypothetical protein